MRPSDKRKNSEPVANKEFPRSRKMQVADRIEKQRPNKKSDSEDVVFSFLSDKQEESKNKGQKFDPEKHLRDMMEKWKERNGGNDWKVNDRRKPRPDRRKPLSTSSNKEEASASDSKLEKRFSRNKPSESTREIKNSKTNRRPTGDKSRDENRNDSRNKDEGRNKDEKKEGDKKTSFFGRFSGKKNKNKGRRS